MDLSLAWPVAVFQTCSFQNSNRRGSYAMRNINFCQTSFLAHIREQACVFPKVCCRTRYRQWGRMNSRCGLFGFLPQSIALWFSFRQILLQTGHRTTGVSRPCHHYRLSFMFVALSFRMKYLWPPVVVFELQVSRFHSPLVFTASFTKV